MPIEKLLQLVLKTLDDLKAIDIVDLDVRELTSVTDYMVICSGRSTRHVKAVADKLAQQMKQDGARPLSIVGKDYGDWILIDFADIVVHVMLPEVRDFYNLEKLWGKEAIRESHRA